EVERVDVCVLVREGEADAVDAVRRIAEVDADLSLILGNGLDVSALTGARESCRHPDESTFHHVCLLTGSPSIPGARKGRLPHKTISVGWPKISVTRVVTCHVTHAPRLTRPSVGEKMMRVPFH